MSDQSNEKVEVLQVPCLECRRLVTIEANGVEMHYGLNIVCPGGDCEDVFCMEAIKAARGQFVSSKCECHYQEPYGFVAEADCPQHDTNEFIEFIRYAERRARKMERCEIISNIYKNAELLNGKP